MILKDLKYIGTATIIVEGKEKDIKLTRVDLKNNGFAGDSFVLGKKLNFYSGKTSGVYLSDLKNIEFKLIYKKPQEQAEQK